MVPRKPAAQKPPGSPTPAREPAAAQSGRGIGLARSHLLVRPQPVKHDHTQTIYIRCYFGLNDVKLAVGNSVQTPVRLNFLLDKSDPFKLLAEIATDNIELFIIGSSCGKQRSVSHHHALPEFLIGAQSFCKAGQLQRRSI